MKEVNSPKMSLSDFLQCMEGLKNTGWTGCYVGDKIRLRPPGAGPDNWMCPMAALVLVECRVEMLDTDVLIIAAPLLNLPDDLCSLILDSIDTRSAGDVSTRASIIDIFNLD